jgi:transposase-like protein
MCGKNFTDATGTIFHRLRLPLKTVFHFTYLLAIETPVNRIHKTLGIAKSAAFRLAKKLRASEWQGKLVSLLEEEVALQRASTAD